MSVTYPLRVFFDCSTAHLSPASRGWLEDGVARTADQPLAWVAGTPFGWFVWADEYPDEAVPTDLAAIMQHARRHGAEYVLFDADAAEDAALPSFDWSG